MVMVVDRARVCWWGHTALGINCDDKPSGALILMPRHKRKQRTSILNGRGEPDAYAVYYYAIYVVVCFPSHNDNYTHTQTRTHTTRPSLNDLIMMVYILNT